MSVFLPIFFLFCFNLFSPDCFIALVFLLNCLKCFQSLHIPLLNTDPLFLHFAAFFHESFLPPPSFVLYSLPSKNTRLQGFLLFIFWSENISTECLEWEQIQEISQNLYSTTLESSNILVLRRSFNNFKEGFPGRDSGKEKAFSNAEVTILESEEGFRMRTSSLVHQFNC